MFDWSNQLFIVLNLVYLTIVLGTIAVVILDNRHPVKTLAWLMVLVFLPIIGLILYFFFGQSVRKERLISKRSFINIARKPLRGYWRKPPGDLPEECQSLALLFRRMNRSMLFGGNQIDIFTDGISKVEALLRAISQARHHIHLEYFIFEDDQVGNRIADALIRKAHEGRCYGCSSLW